jgi:uncharacterized protein YkwD
MNSRPLLAVLALFTLTACAGSYVPKEEPSLYRSLAQPGAQLDAVVAASMISGYRTNSGLPAVTLDPVLMRMAKEQAEAMAAHDKLSHKVLRPFKVRLKAAGYDPERAAENIAAGYDTLAEAFSGWRASAEHKSNMLLAGATRMGIAAVYAPKSKYKVFWTLIIAKPDEKRPS